MFKGVITAIITPFNKDGGIDFEGLEKLIEFQIENGVSGIVACGTTGESPTLTHEEDFAVIKFITDKVNGRISVIAGTGSNSTASVIDSTNEVAKYNIDGILVVAPYYNKPTQEGLYAHYSMIAKSTDLPIVVYNIPGRTGVNIEPHTMALLFKDHKNINCIKDAAGNITQTSSTLDALQKIGREDFTLLSGDDGLTIPMMSVGGSGVISVLSNAYPKTISDMVAHASKNDFESAKKIHSKYHALMAGAFIETNPSPIKEMMFQMGLIASSNVRLPLVNVKEDTKQKLKILIESVRA